MAIFLTILKIIGIVLLCIVGLVIVILLYLLLAPFWFKVDGELNRKMDYTIRAKATTFLHFAQLHIIYTKEKGLDFYATISGPLLKVFSKDGKDKSGDDKDDKSDSAKTIEDSTESKEISKSVESEVIEGVKDNEMADKDKTLKDANEGDSLIDDDKKEPEEKDYDIEILEGEPNSESDESDDDKSVLYKIKGFLYKFNPKTVLIKFNPKTIKAKIEAKIQEIKEKIRGLRDKIDEIMLVLKDNDNKAWLKLIFSELGKFIKSMKFNMKGTDLDFSLGSPDTTGQVCGALALFPPTYDKKVRILPDFEDDDLYFDGNVIIKFRLQLIFVAILLLKVLMDSNTKKILSLIK